ncbi:MAG: tRNA (adenosine(37)-N6)-threonylcarbamoyltransferase complex transferase subunit TsaD [Candidatus Paceibacterota bacterium]|jgi:N6-L-threonylcarbamoyladenine synthase
MKILAIETSCDETAFAVVNVSGTRLAPRFRILKNIIASQVKIHAPFGGVVPNLAKREHLKNLPILLKKIDPRGTLKKNIDAIAVTVGPGLEPALWTGIQFAQELAQKWNLSLAGTNHIKGHLYSFLLSPAVMRLRTEKKKLFPAIGIIVSGGHTMLILMKSLHDYVTLGETYDDAVGESFDKVARLLNLPYPGGPALEQLAKKGNPLSIPFPSPMINQKNYNFSYSGLKTAVLYYLRNLGAGANDFSLSAAQKKQLARIEQKGTVAADIAASFQYAAFHVLATKAIRAVREYGARTIFIGGGVSANKELPRLLKRALKKNKMDVPVIIPPFIYCQDNAAMIAVAAYMDSTQSVVWPLRANGMLDL